MSIDGIQRADRPATAQAPASKPQSQQADSTALACMPAAIDSFTSSRPEGGKLAHKKPINLNGTLSTDAVAYFDTRAGKVDVMPKVKANVFLYNAGGDDPGQEGSVYFGVAACGNNQLQMVTPMFVENFLETDLGKKRHHVTLEAEFGATVLHDQPLDNTLPATITKFHHGFDCTIDQKINIEIGMDLNSESVGGLQPYVGVGYRWATRDQQ